MNLLTSTTPTVLMLSRALFMSVLDASCARGTLDSPPKDRTKEPEMGLPAYYGAGTPQAPPSPSTPGMIKNMHHFALMDLSGA